MEPEVCQGLLDETSRGLCDVLARVSPDLERARLIARRAGYPPGQLPTVITASVFWSTVVEDAANGMISVSALIGAALHYFPKNPELRRYQAELARQPDDAVATGPEHGEPARWLPAADSSFDTRRHADESVYIFAFAAIAFGILGLVALL